VTAAFGRQRTDCGSAIARNASWKVVTLDKILDSSYYRIPPARIFASGANRLLLLRTIDGAAIGALVIVTVVAALTFSDYGLSWDDWIQSRYGDLLLVFYRSGFGDLRAFSLDNLYFYGGGFDMVAALLAKVLPFSLFETRRLAGAMVGVLGLAVTWRIGRHVGGPLAGLVALVLLASYPLYYGHMFMNPKDGPLAAAMAILLLALVRAIDEYPRPRLATIFLVGTGLGLSIGTRVIGAIGAVYLAGAVALILIEETRVLGGRAAALNFQRFVLRLTPGFAVAYTIIGLLWPWAVLNSLNPLRALDYFSHFLDSGPWEDLYGGVWIAWSDMPRQYVLTLFALKTPEAQLVLALAGLILALCTAARRAVPVNRRGVLLLIAAAASLPILLAIALRPTMYNGIRHFVFVTPAIAVLGGLGAAGLIDRFFTVVRSPALAGLLLFPALAVLGLQVTDIVRLHPYEYTYFNRLAGGIRGADRKFMLDYWGLSFKEAAMELRAWLAARNENPPDGIQWKVAVCGPFAPAQVPLGGEFDVSRSLTGSTAFVMALTPEWHYCSLYGPGPGAAPIELRSPILEVKREGVVFARVYDIRSR
jgi:hypothetical protein